MNLAVLTSIYNMLRVVLFPRKSKGVTRCRRSAGTLTNWQMFPLCHFILLKTVLSVNGYNYSFIVSKYGGFAIAAGLMHFHKNCLPDPGCSLMHYTQREKK